MSLSIHDNSFGSQIINYYHTLAALQKSQFVFAVHPDEFAIRQAHEVVRAASGRPLWIEVYARPLMGEGRVNHSAVAKTVENLKAEFANKSEVFIGVGTQDDPRGLQKSITAGAQFAVAHVFVPDVLKVCGANFIPCILGGQTVSEITNYVNLYRKEFPFFCD